MYSARQSSTVEQVYCRLCLGELLWDQESGEKICTNCGAVSAEGADILSQISIARTTQDSPGYRTSNSLAEGVGVSTIIGSRDVDAGGRQIGQSRDLRQLRRLNTMVSWDSKKRRLGKVSSEVQKTTQALGLNSAVAERAFKIYLKEFNAKSVRTRSLAAVAAASVCMACREMEIARPPTEIVASKVGIDAKKFRYYYRILLSSESSKTIPSPASYVSSIAAKASLRGTTERMAIELIDKIKGNPGLVGKRPMSIAAAALYLASVRNGDKTTQLRLAYAAGVTPITIRKRSLEISRMLEPN